MIEYRFADIGDNTLTNPRDNIEPRIGGHREHHYYAEENSKRQVENPIAKTAIDHETQALTQGEYRTRRDNESDTRTKDSSQIGTQIRPDCGQDFYIPAIFTILID
jgi:hypothetical protein